jgi:hypothetical protein
LVFPEEGWDAQVASGQELESSVVWFAALEADAFDPDLLEAAAETESVFVQGASALVFVE